MAELVKVGRLADIPVGSSTVVEVAGKTMAVFHCQDGFYAMENTCPHRGGPLGKGSLAGTTVTCPWHGWQFNVTSGACLVNPAVTQQTYAVTVEGEELVVMLPEGA